MTAFVADTVLMGNALSDVYLERVRQERLRDEGKFSHTCAQPDCPNHLRFAALMEEVGEVAHAHLEGDPDEMRKELIQVAAVCVAWVEGIDASE